MSVTPLHPPWLHVQGPDLMIDVMVAARGTRSRVMGLDDGRLRIQLAAPPADGRANDALVRFLAGALKVARAQVEIVGGQANRRKTVRLAAVQAKRALLALAP